MEKVGFMAQQAHLISIMLITADLNHIIKTINLALALAGGKIGI